MTELLQRSEFTAVESVDQTSSFDFVAADHLVGELGRAGVAAEVGGADAVGDRLERTPRGSRATACCASLARVVRAAPRRRGSSPSGWRRSCPASAGAVPCGGLGHQRTSARSRRRSATSSDSAPGDRAEQRQHEVGEDVAVAVQRRDHERRRRRAPIEQREGRVDQLRLVGDLGVALGRRVHLLLQHPLVDRADRVLRARRRPSRRCARPARNANSATARQMRRSIRSVRNATSSSPSPSRHSFAP